MHLECPLRLTPHKVNPVLTS
ncbi:hypothetical protein MED222_05105 [Vibrio sp. MED222]|nr:hypothetical protein MED222_05105 [Vibrio sp. MED222]